MTSQHHIPQMEWIHWLADASTTQCWQRPGFRFDTSLSSSSRHPCLVGGVGKSWNTMEHDEQIWNIMGVECVEDDVFPDCKLPFPSIW
jgi:hypothetical protein